jgi:hypothetical protein
MERSLLRIELWNMSEVACQSDQNHYYYHHHQLILPILGFQEFPCIRCCGGTNMDYPWLYCPLDIPPHKLLHKFVWFILAVHGAANVEEQLKQSHSKVGPGASFTHVKSFGYGSIPIDTFLVGWTSIYQLFWGSLGTRVLTHPHLMERNSVSHRRCCPLINSSHGWGCPTRMARRQRFMAFTDCPPQLCVLVSKSVNYIYNHIYNCIYLYRYICFKTRTSINHIAIDYSILF